MGKPSKKTASQKTKYIVVDHAVYASTLAQKITDETESVKGRGGAGYNADVQMPQSPVLKASTHNVENYKTRELLYENSSLLRSHTDDCLWEIVRRGWKYVQKGSNLNSQMSDWRKNRMNGLPSPLEQTDIFLELPNWESKLKVAFVESVAKALCIDTTYVCIFNAGTKTEPKPLYQVFSHRHEYQVVLDDNDRIIEVYLTLPAKAAYYKNSGGKGTNRVFGFLTQFNPLEMDKPFAETSNTLKFISGMVNNKIVRKCIVVQPKPSVDDHHGKSYLYRECQTALEKIVLRNFEFCFLKNGGMQKIIVLPESMDDTSKNGLLDQVDRGIQSAGTVIEVDGMRNVTEVAMINQIPIPDLQFATINSHLSEDTALTKQGVEGEAASGALGGNAPIVNQQEDDAYLENLFIVLEPIIKDFNFICFDQDPESYEIYFNRNADMFTPPQPDQSNQSDSSLPPARESSKFTNEENSLQQIDSIDVQFVEHSIKDQYVIFTGNMLQAGVYSYPDHTQGPKSIIYTPDEIKRMTERSVRQGYLELEHSHDETAVGLSEGIGYFEIQGFDSIHQKDVTKFYVKEKLWHSMGEPKTLKMSPYFAYERLHDGSKEIFIKNCAIIQNGTDRASYSGLDASAQLINSRPNH